MALTAIDQFAERAETAEEPMKSVLEELDSLVKAANGLWNTQAERFLLSRQELRSTD